MQKLGRIAAVVALALTVAVPFVLAKRNPLGGQAQRETRENVRTNHRAEIAKRHISPEAHAILLQAAQQRLAERGVRGFPVTGDISENTIFTTIVPCRLIDTRKPLAGILVAGSTRTFTVTGSGNGDPNDPNNPFAKQGGNPAGCGLPGFDANGNAEVQAIEVNYVAVSAAGPGNLQAFPTDEPNAPVTAVINFNKLNPPLSAPLNIANGTVTGVRQNPASVGDINVKANVSNVHLIADVVGYYSFAFGKTLSGDSLDAGLTITNNEPAISDPNDPFDPNQPAGLRVNGGFAGISAYAAGNDYGAGYAVIGNAPGYLGTAVWGNAQGPLGWGVLGTGYSQGVHGASQGGDGVVGVSAYYNGVSGTSIGYGYGTYGTGYSGVRGIGYGQYGYGVRGTGYVGVRGYGVGTTGGVGVLGKAGSPAGSAIVGLSTYTDNNGLDLTSYADANDPDPNNPTQSNFIIAWANGRTVRKFRVDNNGNTYGKSFNTTGADFAEMLPAEEGLQPGDVLTVGQNGKLTRSTQPYQDSVVGIYSTQPGLVGGSKIDGHNDASKAPLAVVGIVPVKVSAENGTIHPGDLLVASSIPGHAMRAGDTRSSGTILGKALEPLIEGTGTIQMLVTLQ